MNNYHFMNVRQLSKSIFASNSCKNNWIQNYFLELSLLRQTALLSLQIQPLIDTKSTSFADPGLMKTLQTVAIIKHSCSSNFYRKPNKTLPLAKGSIERSWDVYVNKKFHMAQAPPAWGINHLHLYFLISAHKMRTTPTCSHAQCQVYTLWYF